MLSTPFDTAIRNAARALIVRDAQLLLLRKRHDGTGERYSLPGGAQEPGETLAEALIRECREEIGTDVRVRELLHVADYFKPRETVPPSQRQVVELVFSCDVPRDYRPHNGHRPDRRQVEVTWVPLPSLHQLPLVPRSLIAVLTQPQRSGVYLGTID